MQAFMWEDFLYQFYPFRYFAATSLASGELPLWNPYTFNGMPFQADIQSAIFYIPNLLLTLFVSNGKLHFFWVELFIILHFIIAGIGMYFLMLHFKLDRIPALFSAFVYMLSGFMVCHGIHQIIINHVSWLPLIFLFFKKTLEEKSIFYTIIGGLILGHSVLAGFPQLSLYIFLLIFFYFIYNFILKAKFNGIKFAVQIILPAAGFIIIALAVTSIQLLPTIELAPHSVRAEITYEKSLEGSLKPEQIITLLIPKFFGEHTPSVQNYWGKGNYGQYWETNFYIGIAALFFTILSLMSTKKNVEIGFWGFTLIFSLLYALGDSFVLHKLFFKYVPGFHLFRNPGRMSLLFTFSAAILSGFGFKEFLQKKKMHIPIIILISVSLLIWALVKIGIFQTHPNLQALNQIKSIANQNANTFLIYGLILSFVLYLFSKSKLPLSIFLALILIVQYVDSFIFGFSFNNGIINPDEYFKSSTRFVNYVKEDGKKEYFRINSRQGGNMILDRNQGMIDRIFLMEGYTPLTLERKFPPAKDWSMVCDLMNAKYRIQVNENYYSGVTVSQTYLPRAYFVYDYIVINDDNKIQEFMKSDSFNPRQQVVLEEHINLPEKQNNNWNNWVAKITEYKLNSISLKTSTNIDGILVLSEIFYPGWVAYIDGVKTKIYRANWNIRAILVGKGEHHINFKFEPNTFYIGMWITISTLLASTIGIVYSIRKRKID